MTVHKLEDQQLTRPLQRLLIQSDRKVRCLVGGVSPLVDGNVAGEWDTAEKNDMGVTYLLWERNDEPDRIDPKLGKWGLERWNNFPKHPGCACWSQIRTQSSGTLCSIFFSPLTHKKSLLAGSILLENLLYCHAEATLSLSLSYIHCWLADIPVWWAKSTNQPKISLHKEQNILQNNSP